MKRCSRTTVSTTFSARTFLATGALAAAALGVIALLTGCEATQLLEQVQANVDARNQLSLTVTANNDLYGTITAPSEHVTKVQPGASTPISASPKSGYAFVNWSVSSG
jgi:hypothetical protein